jgi:hypothetical protein
VVWLHPHVERHVPVSATDLEFDPNELSPIPLSVVSIQELLHVFNQIVRASKGVETDGPEPSASVLAEDGIIANKSDLALSSVEPADRGSTTAHAADHCAHLPGAGLDASASARKRGEP